VVQSLIVDEGDELLAINGKDLAGLSSQQIHDMVENPASKDTLVTFFLSKKDMPSRRCRVVLKRASNGTVTPNTSMVTDRSPSRGNYV
jgi:hypothetical protein